MSAYSKYKDIYTVSDGDIMINNYNNNSNKYGDAIYETSLKPYIDDVTYVSYSWNGDLSRYPYKNACCFYRGGYYNDNNDAGIFGFNHYGSTASTIRGFRVSISLI